MLFNNYLRNLIKRFFRFFYSNEVQLMHFDKIPYFAKERSFISYVAYPDEVIKNKKSKETFLMKTRRDSFSGEFLL